VAAAGIYVIVRQVLDQEPANGGWPGLFGVASVLTWAGAMFLFADVTIDLIGRWKASRPRGDDGPGGPTGGTGAGAGAGAGFGTGRPDGPDPDPEGQVPSVGEGRDGDGGDTGPEHRPSGAPEVVVGRSET